MIKSINLMIFFILLIKRKNDKFLIIIQVRFYRKLIKSKISLLKLSHHSLSFELTGKVQ